MNKTMIILIASLSLLACLSLHGQAPLKLTPSLNPKGSYPSVIKALENTQLIDASGKKKKALQFFYGKQLVGLYFSAHWCGPCRAFTPELVKFRNYCYKNNIPFEVIFISYDHSKKDMYKYMREMKMKWPAAPFDSDLRKQLKDTFGVAQIPTLIIIDWRGEVITRAGRGDVQSLKNGAYKKWLKTMQENQRNFTQAPIRPQQPPRPQQPSAQHVQPQPRPQQPSSQPRP